MMNNRRPILSKEVPVGRGYRHTRLNLSDYTPTSHWVVIKEELERDIDLGNGDFIHVPDQKTATIGTVMALGEEAKALGIRLGDKVIYEQWQGGRWAFTITHFEPSEAMLANPNRMTGGVKKVYEELECLIMSLDSVWTIIREEHGIDSK